MPSLTTKRLALYASGAAVLATGLVIGLREGPGDGDGTGNLNTAAANSPRYTDPDSPYNPNNPMGVRRANAPSLSASEEVADIIGNQDLSTDETALKLMELVLDSKRKIEERIEALDHMCILTDSDKPEPLLKVSKETSLSKQLATLVITESYNHPDRLQGEILLNFLSHKSRDVRRDAVSELGKLTGESHGETPSAWHRAVNRLSND